MTLTRAALYAGVASVLGVWLSSVVSSMPQAQPEVPPVERAAEPVGMAGHVQAQSRRLKDRLASGVPAPRPVRNPFEFEVRPLAPNARAENAAGAVPLLSDVPLATPEPELTLIGIAAHQQSGGAVHTAMMATAGGELIMAMAGETVLGRYTVESVGADRVDLVDPATGTTTRLQLEAH